MKFQLTDDYRYWWPVTVRLPDPNKPGAVVEQTFEARFKALPQYKAREIDAQLAALTTAKEREEHEHDVLREILEGWRGVEGPNGEDVDFNQGSLEMALQFPWFRMGVYEAYAASVRGDEARLKN